jgi:hypothetical protein
MTTLSELNVWSLRDRPEYRMRLDNVDHIFYVSGTAKVKQLWYPK